jgi:hypothetical protein
VGTLKKGRGKAMYLTPLTHLLEKVQEKGEFITK